MNPLLIGPSLLRIADFGDGVGDRLVEILDLGDRSVALGERVDHIDARSEDTLATGGVRSRSGA